MVERLTSRRAAFATLAVLPFAAPVPAIASRGADGALVRLCTEAVRYWDWIDTQCIVENWDDDTLNAHCDRLNDMLETVIAATPLSAAGRAAKARVVARELDNFHKTMDRTDRLVESLVRDCLRDGGAA
ncbi:hypothetical protein [Methylobacterium nonmethylotrophicum]|uniref:Secreted protein n=1 Tax=Methylobacterium nonmethylotrophicum TaxID=1141884 RepID=A0A4Z0NL12_9HYPH|nr:hypothetical protein [Methylobacterium nonmethylotrophicum]TGD96198.1 hypothetical protein EU555_24910 [Methylobacterium nonmethylotrophicum]